jgi:peptidyl-tRNA hydrolase, PTH1 family
LFLIAGLGNPGQEYAGNRHNLGFMVADEVARRLGVVFRPTKLDALVADVVDDDSRLLIAKPQTFMNESGRSIKLIRLLFNIPLENMVVAHDDMDIEFGDLRLKDDGGSAGHNGIQSILDELGEDGFKRIRIGIGRPPGRQDPARFVLKDFTKKEREEVDFIVNEAADIALKLAANQP